jgi:hypothetical protein
MIKNLLIFLFFVSSVLYGQNRNDVWMLGSYMPYGINYSAGSADTFSLVRPMNFLMTNASIGDSLGQILFYTNGIYVANRNHDSLFNTDGFNPGWVTNYYGTDGSAQSQSCVIIPYPNHPDLYYIFHESGEIIYQGPIGAAHPINLSYSVVDMTLDHGYGGIDTLIKNVEIINDTLSWGRLSACKHANGRDYWILAHRYFSNVFYKFLVTPDTIIKYMQPIGLSNPFYNFYGQATFSPDGSKYCMNINDSSVMLLDFDRCSGMLSNSVVISHIDLNSSGDSLAVTGNAFSPSSRFLYVCNNIHIWQYDTWSANVIASEQLVAAWDTFYAPCCNAATHFFEMQLAPDNRIYVSQGVGNDIIHYVKFPDSIGVACNVVQDSFYTAGYNTFCFPNEVNYSLMTDSLSICDTIMSLPSEALFVENLTIKIFPNPAKDNLWIEFNSRPSENLSLEIYDSFGRNIIKHVLDKRLTMDQINLKDFNSGIYVLVITGTKSNYTSRLIIY